MDDSLTIDEINGALPQEIRIVSHIKTGGQGAVFKGTFNLEDCAIKVFNSGDDDIVRRIEREAQFLMEANCDHLVKVQTKVQIELKDSPFIVVVYEFISGGDLQDNYSSALPLAEDKIVKIGLHVSRAIKCMWDNPNRIVHRDIKPENIVKRENEDYVLVDLSYARHINLSNITLMGTVGTRGFMAPEHAIGRKNLTYKADVFSLGVTLYCLATGRHPFNRQQPFGNFTFAPVRSVNTAISEGLESLIHQMMSVSPLQRPNDPTVKFLELQNT